MASADFYHEAAPSGKVDDLAELVHLSEETLLRELRTRYAENTIYTFLSDILIAVNPYKQLGLYGAEAHELYQHKQRWEAPPHIFSVADRAYHNLFEMRKNQCVVISGESGAGKTESAKLVIKHIMQMCLGRGLSAPDDLERKIIESSPLLEAFGNAQTVMNDNSSRFGKYSRLQFDEEGQVLGVQLSEYMLEKSRVIEQAANERNFHIFYYLFAMEDKATYHLTEPSAFQCLGGQLWDDNATMYKEVVQTMRLLGFSVEDEKMLYRVLAAVLHLANVTFDGPEAAYVKDEAPLRCASELLGLDFAAVKEVLLSIESIARGETIRRQYKPSQAYDCRDALAKALYSGMFGWMVNSINTLLSPAHHAHKITYEIGVLDIFGFECFKENSFEQLCINVAHEQLQFFFNRHTFSLELAEYAEEGIDTALVSYKDNEPVLRMVMDKSLGLFALLDEESGFPQATPASLVEKLLANLTGKSGFCPVKMAKQHPSFAIEHFAGIVEYSAATFLEKNRDNLAPNIVDLMQDSKLSLVRDVFQGEVLNTGQIRPKLHKPQAGQATSKVNRVAPMLSVQFRNSLFVLVDRMNKCYPHFVRCIKPNLFQRPNDFVDEMVTAQLRYTGVLEVTRIRQEGFAWRPTFGDFVQRYKIIAFSVLELNTVESTPENAVKIIKAAKLDRFAVGKTKLFLKFYHLHQMEARIQRFYLDVVRTQSAVRRKSAWRVLVELQRRAKLEASERAALDQKDMDARTRKQEEKRRLERDERDRRMAELAHAAEKAAEEKRLADARAQEAAALHKNKEQELDAARHAANEAAEEARRLEERKEAEQAMEQAGSILKEVEELQQERHAILEAAEIARQAAREHEEAMQELVRDLDEARKAKAEADEETAKIQRDRAKSRKDRSRKAAEEALAAQQKAEEEAKLAEAARLATEAAEAAAREAEEARRLAESREEQAKEDEFMQALKMREEEAKKLREAAEEQARRAAEAMAAREAAEKLAKQKELERLEEMKRIADERTQEEQELAKLDWKRPEFNLIELLSVMLKPGTLPAVTKEVVVEPRSAKGYLLLMKTHNIARTFLPSSSSSALAWKRRFVVLDLTVTGTGSILVYDSDKLGNLKETYSLESVVRVFSPQPRLRPDAIRSIQRLFVIELTQRSFYVQGLTEDSMNVWITAINAVTQASRSIRRNSRASMFFDSGSVASLRLASKS